MKTKSTLVWILLSACFILQTQTKCPNVIDGNVLNCTYHDTDDVCLFQCKEGYYSNTNNLTCLSNGNWNEKPICNQITCPRLEHEVQHSIPCEKANYSGICYPKCEDGYAYSGTRYRQWFCTVYGWAPRFEFTCREMFIKPSDYVAWKDDEAFLIIQTITSNYDDKSTFNVVMLTPDGKTADVEEYTEGRTYVYYFNHPVKYSDEGVYTFIIKATREDGYWYTWTTNTTVTVRGSTCSRFTIAEGEVKCEENDVFQTICSFTCNEGFYLEGNKSLNCTYDTYLIYEKPGQWLETPSCQANGIYHFQYDSIIVNMSLGIALGMLTMINIGLLLGIRKLKRPPNGMSARRPRPQGQELANLRSS